MLQIDSLTAVIEVLEKGGIILFPTDTIWGIGCDATNEDAIRKIYALKQRDLSKPFILLAESMPMVKQYVQHVHPKVETLLHYHTRPLTIIYEQAINLPDIAVAQDKSVGIRIPQDAFCQELIKALGKPIVATSANISNEPFPKRFGEISSAVIQGVDHVVQHLKRDRIEAEPSVIVRLSAKGDLIFLRE